MFDPLKKDYLEVLQKKEFKPLQPRKRSFIGSGQSSIAISDTDHNLLLVTDHNNARRIQPFIELVQGLKELGTPIPAALIMPKTVGYHLELSSLMDHDNPKAAMKKLKGRTESLNTHIQHKNVVYSMEKFDGSAEDLYKNRFKQDTIDLIMAELQQALDFMHEYGFTHNDIAERNIFIKGQYPNLRIGLGDFGSCTYNPVVDRGNLDLTKHHEKAQLDLLRLKGVRKRLSKLLEGKQSPDKRLALGYPIGPGRPRRTAAVKCLNTMLDVGVIEAPDLIIPAGKAKALILSPDKKRTNSKQKNKASKHKTKSKRMQTSSKK